MSAVMEWATVDSPAIAEITTNCVCVYCDNCDMTNYNLDIHEDKCEQCAGDYTIPNNCYGDCHDYIVEHFADNVFPEAMKRLGNPTYVRIEGRNMGWQNRSGYAIAQGTWESVYNKLAINGDYTLRFTLAGDSFTVVRSSHDEPTGAYFTIRATQTLSSKMSIDEAIASNLVDEYGCHKGCGEYFYSCNCEVE